MAEGKILVKKEIDFTEILESFKTQVSHLIGGKIQERDNPSNWKKRQEKLSKSGIFYPRFSLLQAVSKKLKRRSSNGFFKP